MSQFPVSYYRNLPHLQPLGAILFLTYRLAGSLPVKVLKRLQFEREEEERQLEQDLQLQDGRKDLRARIRRKIFLKYDHALNQADTGPTWLADRRIAEIVFEAMLRRHPEEYDLICFSIMPNHVHQVFTNVRPDVPIYRTIGHLKSYTASKANRLLGRSGPFWQDESFDHAVRAGRLAKTIRYVLANPVVAGLAADWRAWPFSWLNPKIKIEI